ncbi:MAG: Na/Pi cotransporter family protein [Candidatus Pacebacteria bacterium]|nr:Na/Pi cotransporter family protein [Candidatus Paceibacterota bacterium]
MIEIETIFEIIGGMAILLYGIHLSGVSLQKIMGFKLEEILGKTKDSPIKGLAIGTGITAVIQSSGTTITMLIGFMSAGLLGCSGAVPAMLGANIGSTITTQLASFQVGIYALPILTIGVFIHIFAVRKIKKNIGEAIIGFSFLFLGMYFVFNGMHSVSHSLAAVDLINHFDSSKIAYIFILAFLTLLLQSSSATSVLVVALGASQIIDLGTALFMILGVNLGSSLKVIYMGLKRKGFLTSIAIMHLLFNMFGILLFLIFFKYFDYLAGITSDDTGRQIANGHTLYNIISALIFLPFVPFIVKFINKHTSRIKAEESKLSYLSRKLLYTPSVALGQANRAVVDMAKTVNEMLEKSRLIFFENKTDLFKRVEEYEEEMDEMTGKISEYLAQISQQNLSKKDLMKLYSLMHITTDLEHLSDHVLTVSELFVDIKEEKIEFSEKSIRELTAIFGKLRIMQNLVVKSLEEDNLRLAHEIIKHENKVDEIVKKSLSNHLERMNRGICTLEKGKYFTEILTNLERIGDHSDNIAYAVVDRFRYKGSSDK